MFWIIAVLVVVAIGLGAYGLWGSRARDPVRIPASTTAVVPADETAAETQRWVEDADRSFADLSEAAKCDLVFAMGKLDNPRAEDLLARALHDPSEAVALAAAHALLSNGRAAVVASYEASNPDRARRLLDTVALLG
jgi:hypothetical protein